MFSVFGPRYPVTGTQRAPYGVPVVRRGDYYAGRDGRVWYEIAPEEGGPMISYGPGLGDGEWTPWRIFSAISSLGVTEAARAVTGAQPSPQNTYDTVAASVNVGVARAEAQAAQGKADVGGVATAGIGTGGVVTGSGRSGTHVRTLQNAMIAAGCTLPRYGADGIWGSETQMAFTSCFAPRVGGLEAAYAQYPFARDLMGQTSTGGTARQPTGGATRTPSGTTPPPPIEAGFFSVSNPWMWVVITVGFVGIAGVGYFVTRPKPGAPYGELPDEELERAILEKAARAEYLEAELAKRGAKGQQTAARRAVAQELGL